MPAPADPAAHGFSAERLARIPAFLRGKYLEPGLLPNVSLLVARDGVPVLVHHEGQARAGRPVDDATIFRIASMTKPIASIAFMQLVERGLVALSDPVHRFIPEFRDLGVFVAGGGQAPFQTRRPAALMRMIDLLRHTAGLTYGFQERTPVDAAYRKARLDDFALNMSSDEWIAALAELPLDHDPGAAWTYGVSTDVLGVLVERISGEPFDAYLKRHVLEPLGMVDSVFLVAQDKADRLADAYVFHPIEKMRVFDDGGAGSRWAKPRAFHSGGGGLAATLGDYHRFCAMLLNGGTLDGRRVIGEATLRLMTVNHLPDGKDLTQVSRSLFSEADNAGVGFGLGFAVTLDPAKTLVPGSAGDFYWGGMFSTGFFCDPVQGIHMVFMTQLMPSSTYPVRREIKTMIYAALEEYR